MGKRTEFLFLSEPDCIAAGVLDARKCVDNAEEVFKLLAQGDYLMGGAGHNSHGLPLVFPQESPFPNMPLAGPDRRFVAMPAYLGGRFDICGVKWYGSNAANKHRGLPRSVLTVMLNDKETGEPLCLMSANLSSAARTGAVPAVGARYLARQDAETLTCVGCGPIGRGCLDAIATVLPNLKRVVCNNRSPANAMALAEHVERDLGLTAVVEPELETAVRQADVISIAVSRTAPLHLKREWVQPGCTLLASGPFQCDEALWLDMKIVLDNTALHQTYVQEGKENHDPSYGNHIGTPIYQLIDAGKLPSLEAFPTLGKIILGEQGGRTGEEEILCFINDGMAIFDMGLCHDLYETALEQGIGQKLVLWDSAAQCAE